MSVGAFGRVREGSRVPMALRSPRPKLVISSAGSTLSVSWLIAEGESLRLRIDGSLENAFDDVRSVLTVA